MSRAVFLLGILCISCGSSLRAENWPMFRGPNAGVSDGQNLPTFWDTKKNVVWSVSVPGRGWSSPISWGDRIFLTSVIKDGKYEDAKKGLYFGGERGKAPEDMHHWLVICIDAKTGSTMWERKVAKGKPATSIHIKNSYASETPVTDGDRVYAYFGNQGVFCFDLDGKPLWEKKFDAMPTRFSWGTASSPALHDGKLFIVNDNEKESYLVCLDAKSGKQLWRVERDEKSNWSTPFIWTNDKRTELITTGTKKIRSYDLDGKLLWEFGGMSMITIPTPFARHGLLYIGSGYVMDKNKPMYAVKPGASGDITLKENENFNDFIQWKKNTAPYNPTPLVYGDYMYILYDLGYFGCFDARTGKPVYEKERINNHFTVSPWAYDGKIFCLNEDGETLVIKAGPKFEILGRNKLDEMCMACPAVSGKSLFIRTLTKLYKIENQH
jgi:outer membrane protein assembly factor BamB